MRMRARRWTNALGWLARSTCQAGRVRVDGFVNEADAAGGPVRVAEPVVIPMVPGGKVYLGGHPVAQHALGI